MAVTVAAAMALMTIKFGIWAGSHFENDLKTNQESGSTTMLHIQLPVSMRVINIYFCDCFWCAFLLNIGRPKNKSIRKPKAKIYCTLAANGMEWLNNGLCEKKKRIRTKLMVTLLKIHCDGRWMIFFGWFFIFTSLDSLWNLIIYYFVFVEQRLIDTTIHFFPRCFLRAFV